MENKNVNVEEIKEGVPAVVEDVTTNGNIIGKVAIVTGVAALVAGGVILVKKIINKRKASKTEVVEISEVEETDNETAE